MTDDVLTAAFNKTFGKNISKNALRKKRQRLKIKKKPGHGICEVENGKD